MTPAPALSFLGGTRTVTGSRFLVEADDQRILLDCGLFQGLKRLRERNWQAFPVDPASIDTVIVSHAHIDHSGYLPRLVRNGFRGRVVCTPESAALIRILLADSGRLQEEEARYANRVGSTKHSPALPLYTAEDAAAACELLDPVERDISVALAGDTTCVLRRAGHILGAATVSVTTPGVDGDPRRLVFSGDLGRQEHPILAPPAPVGDAAVILVESTYGDRRHRSSEQEIERLGELVSETAARGGTIVIPAFAVDRTEVVLHALHRLERSGAIPELPIHVDSPMALAVLEVYRDAIERGSDEIRTNGVTLAAFDETQVTECHSTEESKRLAEITYPSIIISASGMATGGRVLHHLTRLLPDRRNAVVLTGFQAEGTRGADLARGTRSIKIFGSYVPVRAEVEVIEGFSVHADADEILGWLGTATGEPDACFAVHGTADASEALAREIVDRLGWNAVVPQPEERVRF